MRNLLLFLLLFSALGLKAQSPALSVSELKKGPSNAVLRSQVARVVRKAASQQIISEQPAGAYSNRYSRSDNYINYEGDDQIFNSWHDNYIGEVVTNGNDIYLKQPWLSLKNYSWLHGTIDGNKVNITLPQAVMALPNDSTGKIDTLYATKMYVNLDTWNVGIDSVSQVYTMDLQPDGSFSNLDDTVHISLCDADGNWYYYSTSKLRYVKITADTLSEAQTGLTFEPYVLEYTKSKKTKYVAIRGAKSADKIYLSHLVPSLPDAVMTGDISGDKVTFKNGQYFGPDSETHHQWFFNAADYGPTRVFDHQSNDSTDEVTYFAIPEITFDYVAEKDSMSAPRYYFAINRSTEQIRSTYRWQKPSIYKYREPAVATLQDPEFSEFTAYSDDNGYGSFELDLSNFSQEGSYLHTGNLYYQIFIDGVNAPAEDGTQVIPYELTDYDHEVSGESHTIYFYQTDPKKITAQLFYKKQDGTLIKSNIVEYDVATGTTSVTTGIATLSGQAQPSAPAAIYDVTGKRLGHLQQGVNIVRYANGKVVKVLKK